jgi:hypothetical protein
VTVVIAEEMISRPSGIAAIEMVEEAVIATPRRTAALVSEPLQPEW